jgi:putative membrane protein
VVVFTHWSASWPALLCYLVVAAAHLTGLRRLGASTDASAGRDLERQALLFQVGLLLALLALVSPAGYFSAVFLWVRAVQFLVLAIVAPGLMVLGAPWPALRAAFRRVSPDPAPSPDRATGPDRTPWLLARPTAAVVVVNVVWLAWQLPAVADRSRGSAGVALAGHACCLAAGMVFWLQMIGSRPLSPKANPLRRAWLVAATVGVMTVLGMVLVFGSGVLYPGYAGPAHHLMTVLDDQQLAGAVLWMGVLPALIAVAIALVLRWLNEEESTELSADLNRLLTPRKDAWSARPGIR